MSVYDDDDMAYTLEPARPSSDSELRSSDTDETNIVPITSSFSLAKQLKAKRKKKSRSATATSSAKENTVIGNDFTPDNISWEGQYHMREKAFQINFEKAAMQSNI